MSSLRAVVTDIQQKSVCQLSLYIHIPDLYIAELVVWIDGKIIRHRSGGSPRKSICKRQITGCRNQNGISFSRGERRLKCKILNDRSILREVVIDSVPGAHHRLLQRPPCQSQARSKIISIRLYQRSRKGSEC